MRQLELQVRTVRTGLGLIAAVLLLVAATAGQAADQAKYVPGQYIIHVLPGTDLATVQATAAKMGCALVGPVALADTYLIAMSHSPKSPTMAHTTIAGGSYGLASWVVDRIQPNYICRLLAIPNDPMWNKMWDMVQIRMPGAWDIAKGSQSVIVAVNDSGVAQHPDLAGRILPGYDFVDNDPDPSPVYLPNPPTDPNGDDESHGTHVSGTIAAQGNNSIGVCGVCWDGVQILPVRVGTGKDGLPSDAIISGLDFAMKNGANVVNMSYGMYVDDPAQHAKLQELAAAGIILVAGAGNDSTDVPLYPAAYSEVVSVSATGPYETLAPYSNYGKIDIAAPGGDADYGEDGCVWSTIIHWSGGIPAFDYAGYPWQGTSMACPHVAGAAALLLSYGVPKSEVVSRLLTSARPPKSGGMDKVHYGAGILDVQAALSDTLLRIIEPGKGANVTSVPHFRINVRNVTLSSIKVYLDYADLDDNGIPDNLGEAQIINSTNVNYFWDAATGTIEFDWLDSNLHLPQAAAPLKAGVHEVYVSGTATTGGNTVSDWAAFFVITRKIEKGIHMVSFPYALDDRMVNTPAEILLGAKFGATDRPRSTLIRWIAAPKSAFSTTPIGYQTYVPDTLFDQTWVTPSYTAGGQSVLLGGGSFHDLLTGEIQTASPVGSGFWLILPQDVYVDETFPTLESQGNFDGSKGFDIPLYMGWNLIGNPYAHAVPWRAALLSYQGQTKSLLDAESAGWVRSTLYGYGGSTTGYVRVTDRDSLEAFVGYWLMAQVGGIDPSSALNLTVLP